jgi:hypothetical protein
MRASSITLTLLAGCIASGHGAFSQEQPGTDKPSSYRLEFLGKDPAVDWARTVSVLADKNLVPTKTLTLGKGQDPCGAVIDQLNFRSLGFGCSAEMRGLIAKLNPNLPANPQIGQEIRYPDLPVETMKWRAGFNNAIPEDKTRYLKVNSLWKQFKLQETQAGTETHVQFKGLASQLDVPVTPETRKELEKIETYNSDIDRFQTRAVAREKEPDIKSRFAFNTPIDWAEGCNQTPAPTPPHPPYISLLNATKTPACATQCTRPNTPGCPQIVLVDQPVAAHPDLAPATGQQLTTVALAGAGGATPVTWCPFGQYDSKVHHGTHLAGIMVSSGASTGFTGLAPNVGLDSRNIPDAGIKALLDEKFSSPFTKIYVYAGRFANDYTIVGEQTRRSKPPQVEDMLASTGLWVVAAGQVPQVDVGKLTPHSPMNLGDQKNVIVVTSCEDCYSASPTVSSWANYSSEGLVTLAAPGGADGRKIPSTISATEFGLAYGTSQATALVAGLAASMAACYPQRLNAAPLLKQRLETISRPAPWDDARVSAGIVDASLAFNDPDVQWIKLSGDTLKSSPRAWFCTEKVRLQNVADGTELAPIPAKQVRAIFREERAGQTGWRFKYQVKAGTPVVTTPLVKMAADGTETGARSPRPLFYVDNAQELQLPKLIELERVESLVLGLEAPKVSSVGACQ